MRIVQLILALLWGGASLPAKDYTPMFGPIRLISGAGAKGFADGLPVKARYRDPQGLALAGDGKVLYVADTGNHALRRIRLTAQNRVDTLCGDGQPGIVSAESPTSKCQLNRPTDVVAFSDDSRVLVYDRGNRRICSIDPRTGVASTAFTLGPGGEGGTHSVGMALSPDQKALFVVDPVDGSLLLGDLASGKLNSILLDPAHLKEKGAYLAFVGDSLRCVPVGSGDAYALDLKGQEPSLSALLALTGTGEVKLVPRYKMDTPFNGMAGMGQEPSSRGVMTWDAPSASIRQFEDVRAQQLGMSDVEMISRSSPLVGANVPTHRTYFVGPLNLAYDPKPCVIYVSEKDSNRIQAIRNDAQANTTNPFLNNHNFPNYPAPGVERILFFGSSLQFFSNEEGTSLGVPGKFMTQQFELYLNAMSALAGTGRQFEVIHSVLIGRYIGAGEAYIMERKKLLKDYHVDHVVFPMDDRSVMWDLWAWGSVQTEDDVPLRTEDSEYATKSTAEKLAGAGPLTKELIKTCRESPDHCGNMMVFEAGGQLGPNMSCGSQLYFFDQPIIRDFTVRIETKIAARLKKTCSSVGSKAWVFLIPAKDYFGMNENDLACSSFDGNLPRDMNEAFNGIGLETINLLEELQVIEPQLFPLWNPKDGHFRYRGHQWLGYLMAKNFLERLEKPQAVGKP